MDLEQMATKWWFGFWGGFALHALDKNGIQSLTILLQRVRDDTEREFLDAVPTNIKKFYRDERDEEWEKAVREADGEDEILRRMGRKP